MSEIKIKYEEVYKQTTELNNYINNGLIIMIEKNAQPLRLCLEVLLYE